ncbi:MAG: trypsin-like peptidase domain-containing protein [Patescibacteria group bacterium]|nr:trypsin-like peptidase domain-containing protein [Patescibacteria group bacterium]
MEHLSKQQIVLVSILVSFVTSIATGVVMLALFNSNSSGPASTIQQVIEQTVGGSLSSGTAAVNNGTSPADNLTNTVATVAKSIALLHDGVSSTTAGLGIVVSAHGTIMADKTAVGNLTYPFATYSDGHVYPLVVVRSQVNGDIVFLDPVRQNGVLIGTSTEFVPAIFGGTPKLGDTVVSLGGSTGGVLGLGIVQEIGAGNAASSSGVISTTIASSKVSLGSPLFNLSGAISGIYVSSFASTTPAQFYPISLIRAAIPR